MDLRSSPSELGRIAVLIPCHNEESTIAGVVREFRTQIPLAAIYVYDNNSTDRTSEIARRAGAIIRREPYPGKGNVIRRMFADIDADTYVLVDGDGTYDAGCILPMFRIYLEECADMVTGVRVADAQCAYRLGHRIGNRVLTVSAGVIFGNRCRDMLSGYRVLSRRFVKSFPALSRGFEIETELTVHALEMRMIIAEIETPYYARPRGSRSKLNTYKDGVRILMTIVRLVKEERPLRFFAVMFLVLTTIAIALALPIVITFMNTGLVPRFPTAILATGTILLGFLSLACGLILDTVTRGRQELKRMQYLSNGWRSAQLLASDSSFTQSSQRSAHNRQ